MLQHESTPLPSSSGIFDTSPISSYTAAAYSSYAAAAYPVEFSVPFRHASASISIPTTTARTGSGLLTSTYHCATIICCPGTRNRRPRRPVPGPAPHIGLLHTESRHRQQSMAAWPRLDQVRLRCPGGGRLSDVPCHQMSSRVHRDRRRMVRRWVCRSRAVRGADRRGSGEGADSRSYLLASSAASKAAWEAIVDLQLTLANRAWANCHGDSLRRRGLGFIQGEPNFCLCVPGKIRT